MYDKKSFTKTLDAYKSMYEDTKTEVDEGIGKLIKKGIEKLKPSGSKKDDPHANNNDHMHIRDNPLFNKKINQNSHTDLSMHHQSKARELKDAGKHDKAKHHDAAAVAHTEASESASKNNDKVDKKLSNAAHLASSKAHGGKKFEHLHQTVAQRPSPRKGRFGFGDSKSKAHNHPLARDAIRAHGISQPEDTKTVVKRNAGHHCNFF